MRLFAPKSTGLCSGLRRIELYAWIPSAALASCYAGADVVVDEVLVRQARASSERRYHHYITSCTQSEIRGTPAVICSKIGMSRKKDSRDGRRKREREVGKIRKA